MKIKCWLGLTFVLEGHSFLAWGPLLLLHCPHWSGWHRSWHCPALRSSPQAARFKQRVSAMARTDKYYIAQQVTLCHQFIRQQLGISYIIQMFHSNKRTMFVLNRISLKRNTFFKIILFFLKTFTHIKHFIRCTVLILSRAFLSS